MQQTRLHIGNLPDRCSKESLKDLFDPYGKVIDLTVIKNYGFVTFSDKNDAENALKDLHKTKLLGHEITVAHSKPKAEGHDRDKGHRKSSGKEDWYYDKRQSRNINSAASNNNNSGLFGQLGGILGAAPGGVAGGGVPALGILNTLNAAVAGQLEQSRQVNAPRQESRNEIPNDQPDPDVRVRREVVHVRDAPKAAELGLTSGYVIHERYYVDGSHPLLRGIPLKDFPRMNKPRHSSPPRTRETDPYQDDSYRQPRNTGGFSDRSRDRSPLRNRSPSRSREFDYARY